jgi:hypothetical protein
MNRKFIPLVIIAMFSTGLFNVPPVSAVTYGDPVEAPQVEFPEVVPVWVGGKSFCTGTLITQQVVLTAAHCVYGQAGPFQISVGGSTLKNGRLIDIDATWYHPRYDAAFNQNDIGLLHLKTPANVSRLGNLPSGSLKSVGKKFLIVGWGTDQNDSVTGKLHRLSLNEQAVASKKFFKGIYNSKTMIGAGRYFPNEILYGGGCTGDSGGPLYMGALGASKTVIGLTAFGARGCTTYKPTVFTRVDFYLAEINKGIQLLNSRAATAPIPTGSAAPAGAGPTTTTTLAPLMPLTVKFRTGQEMSSMGGLDGIFETNTISPNKVTKICFVVNGTPIPEYDGGEIFFNWSKYTQSGGLGCFENVTNGNVVNWSILRIRSYQSSTIYAVIYDSKGRSVTTPTLRVAGTRLSRVLEIYGISKTEYSSTTEISVKSYSGSEDIKVTKVCLIVTMNGSPYSSIASGRNGWNDIGGGCVAPSSGPDRSLTYTSSSMISNPAGLQDWIVEGWVYSDDGSVKASSSLAFAS